MNFDLATAKTRLGITGTTQDAQITALLASSLALAEAYCDRWFQHVSGQIEEFTHVGGRTLSLKRYPIDPGTIPAMNDRQGGTLPKYHIERSTGLIRFDSRLEAHELVVSYSGGYQTLPDPLVTALWPIFDQQWANRTNTGGGGVGAGVVQSITSEGQTVRFFDPSSGGASAVGLDPDSGLPISVVGLLDLYRRESA